jgi:hypothetical protein
LNPIYKRLVKDNDIIKKNIIKKNIIKVKDLTKIIKGNLESYINNIVYEFFHVYTTLLMINKVITSTHNKHIMLLGNVHAHYIKQFLKKYNVKTEIKPI